MSTAPIVCLYHKQCVDGTTAAAVVLRKYPHALFFPVGFDSKDTDIALVKEQLTSDTHIIYVDNAIGLAALAPLKNKITVLDHHVSEHETINALVQEHPHISYTYAEDESGASLAWHYFFPEDDLPKLIEYVRDIDLYTNAYVPESEWLTTYLSEFRDNPAALLPFFNQSLDTPLALGKVLVEYTEKELEKMCQLEPVYLDTTLGLIPAYNITNYQSKAGHILSGENESAVILYKISGDFVRCSIRSRDGQMPSALAVAQLFGGGGHTCAAGARIDREEFFSLVKSS